jgi:hypothetical protein
MPKRYVAAAAFFLPLLIAAPTHGQSPPQAPAGARDTVPLPCPESSACPSWACAVDGLAPCPDSRGPRVWGDAAYLLWWLKDGPLGVPLVTTGSNDNPLAGILGQPDTLPVFGGSGLDYGTASGVKATLGFWIDEDQAVGLEAGGFLLERRAVGLRAGSDAAGVPPLVVPFFDAGLGFQTGTIIASPVGQPFAGSVSVASHSRLWGARADAVLALNSPGDLRLELLAGYRHLSLDEDLALGVSNRDLTFDIQNQYADRFATGNRFDGGQLGARIGWHSERLSVLLQGEVALGNAYQTVNRTGASLQTGPDAFAPGPHEGGILVQQTSIGRHTSNTFAVVPSAEARVGVRLLPNLTASVGYDFLYWSSVVRPGAQIDPQVNPSQSAISGFGQLVGPARPAPLFNRTDFWAQGLEFGLEFRY